MKTKFNGILTLLIAFSVQFVFAQKTVSGTVSDDSGPLPGASVIIKGTKTGTETDFDGKYSLQAKQGDVLQISFVGSQTKEITVGTEVIYNVVLQSGNILDEIVITAQGIKKEKKALGYAVSSLDDDQIKDKGDTDFTRALTGKVAGLNITAQNGLSGSSNSVVIRGLTSFTGSNDALYVIDGVPMNSGANAAAKFDEGLNMGSSRSVDIDPNNIEKIEILKGLTAATLYGQQGRNGVILITTKTGSGKKVDKKQEVEVSSSFFFNELASLPDYQNKFGGGFDQAFGWFYSNWGPGFYKDGVGGWGSDPTIVEPGVVDHPYATSGFLATNYPDWQQQFIGQTYDWKPRNSVADFFRTGHILNNAVNFTGRSDDGNHRYSLSYGHSEDIGFTPGNELGKDNFGVGGNSKLSNKLNLDASLNYSKTNYISPPIAFSNGSSAPYASIFGDLLYTPRNIDFFELPYQLPDGSSIYYRDDNAIQHPLWTLHNSKFNQLTNRVFGKAGLSFDFNDNYSTSFRAALDSYSEDNYYKQNRGGVSDDPKYVSGLYSSWNNRSTITDYTLLFSGKNLKLSEKLNLTFDLGLTSKREEFKQYGIESDDQQIFDWFDHSNFTNHNQREKTETFNSLGAFAQSSFDYNNIIYLNIAGRNDWVSNIYNNSLFYPSVSVSFLPLSALPNFKSKAVNYLKLRANYGTSANFPTGYPTATKLELLSQQWFDDAGGYIVGNTNDVVLGNPNIKPELQKEYEFGIESKFINNRVKLDVSYYLRKIENMIVDMPIPASSGYTYTQTNIGLIDINGIEADLGIDIVKQENGFNWNSQVNFTKNVSEVKDLGNNSDLIMYEGFTNLGNGARVGYPLGAMFGSRVKRDANGNYIVNDAGSYVAETVDEEGVLPYIGNPNPDFVMNYINNFSYKNFSFSFNINHTSGGDIYSTTIVTLLGRGLTTDTIDRLGTFVLPGVNETTGQPNTVQINNSDYYFGNIFAGPAQELSVFDASVIRLQEVSLSYELPKKYLDNTPFGRLIIKFSGNNLWYNAYNTPKGINFDPNVNGLGGNGQGFEFLTAMSGRKYGMSVNLSF